MKKIWVISLGGSILLSEKNSKPLLLQFEKMLSKLYGKNKFVIVCGGGAIARQYIHVLRKEHQSIKSQSFAGIEATRMNARFVMRVFGKKANDLLPDTMKSVKNNLKNNKVVITGSFLRYRPNQTSDSTAAQIANYLGAEFINVTNVDGLYTADPRKNKNAKLISEISWKEFAERAQKIKYKPGEHFVLDQNAAQLIKRKKIATYIVGPKLGNLKNLIEGKSYKGTTITC